MPVIQASEKQTRRRQNYKVLWNPRSAAFARVSADISPRLSEVVDVLVLHAFEFRDPSLRKLLLCTCRLSSSIFRGKLMSNSPPSMGDGAWPPPIYTNARERTSWDFASCHFCTKPAIDRHTLFCLRSGERGTVLMCRDCRTDCSVRSGPLKLPGGRTVLSSLACVPPLRAVEDDALVQLGETIRNFAAACGAASVRIQNVSVQTWTGPYKNSIVKIHQLSLFATGQGRKQLNVSIQVTSSVVKRLKKLNSTDEKLLLLVTAATTVQQRTSLVKTLATWWAGAQVRQTTIPSRKGVPPIRLLCLPCQHSYGSYGGRQSRLLTCTACCPNGDTTKRKKRNS